MIMQNFWVTNKEHYGMLWYFLEWSIKNNDTAMKFYLIRYANFAKETKCKIRMHEHTKKAESNFQ